MRSMRHAQVARVAAATLAVAAVAGVALLFDAEQPIRDARRDRCREHHEAGPDELSSHAHHVSRRGRSTPVPSKPSAAEQARLDAELRDAAWKDDLARREGPGRQGRGRQRQGRTEQSAYLVATSEGRLALLRLALANGAKVDDKDSWNGTGLIRAAERGHALVVGELLRAGIDRNHVNRIGYQAIHEAVWLGRDTTTYVDTLRVLVSGGVELTRPSRGEGLTPLQMARERGFDRLTGVLVKATTARPVGDADAALLAAAARGDADAVASALRAGADLEVRDAKERTALLLAVTGDHVDAARVLVAMGADPDALDDRHDTPGWSPASPAASRCSRRSCRPDPT